MVGMKMLLVSRRLKGFVGHYTYQNNPSGYPRIAATSAMVSRCQFKVDITFKVVQQTRRAGHFRSKISKQTERGVALYDEAVGVQGAARFKLIISKLNANKILK